MTSNNISADAQNISADAQNISADVQNISTEVQLMNISADVQEGLPNGAMTEPKVEPPVLAGSSKIPAPFNLDHIEFSVEQLIAGSVDGAVQCAKSLGDSPMPKLADVSTESFLTSLRLKALMTYSAVIFCEADRQVDIAPYAIDVLTLSWELLLMDAAPDIWREGMSPAGFLARLHERTRKTVWQLNDEATELMMRIRYTPTPGSSKGREELMEAIRVFRRANHKMAEEWRWPLSKIAHLAICAVGKCHPSFLLLPAIQAETKPTLDEFMSILLLQGARLDYDYNALRWCRTCRKHHHPAMTQNCQGRGRGGRRGGRGAGGSRTDNKTTNDSQTTNSKPNKPRPKKTGRKSNTPGARSAAVDSDDSDENGDDGDDGDCGDSDSDDSEDEDYFPYSDS